MWCQVLSRLRFYRPQVGPENMPIPPFTLDGILPPFLGRGPGDSPDFMSPHVVSVVDVVIHFATSNRRRDILIDWLRYRQQLRAIGITRGLQWLSGSFVEDKAPNDLDIVLFIHRPARYRTNSAFMGLVQANYDLFERFRIKSSYKLDVFPVDLDASAMNVVAATAYWLQLFSHQRITSLWKGILEVEQSDMKDEAALLAGLTTPAPGGIP
jgi:uncharacterized protein DUF6932